MAVATDNLVELAIEALVDASIAAQKEAFLRERLDSEFDYFCHVRVRAPRRAGTTTALLRIAATKFERPLVIVRGEFQVRHASEAARHLGIDLGKVKFEYLKTKRHIQPYDAILVDTPEFYAGTPEFDGLVKFARSIAEMAHMYKQPFVLVMAGN